jgi:hypothetical protein
MTIYIIKTFKPVRVEHELICTYKWRSQKQADINIKVVQLVLINFSFSNHAD